MFDLFHEILQTLQHNKLRTTLTGFAVAWGIFMLIVLLGMGNGVTNSFREEVMKPGSQKINIWGGRTSKPYHGYREGRDIPLKSGDITQIDTENDDFVSEANSTIYGNNPTITAGTRSISSSYVGVYPSEFISSGGDKTMAKGRFINDRDMSTQAKVVVMSERDEQRLFPDEDGLGKYVNISGLAFKVIGVYTSRWSRNIYIPFTTAKMLAGNNDRLGSVSVLLKNVSTEEDGNNAEKELRKTLAATHDFNPDDESAVWIWNQFSQGMKGMAGMNILTTSIWILGLLTLLSGVVGISNIMFVSVKERTHEIGIRRAIGARPRSILIQVIAESVAITILFGYIGIVLGTAVTQIFDMAFGDSDFIKNPTVSISIAIQVTIVLIVAGAFAGLFPALKAIKVKPVEALRDE